MNAGGARKTVILALKGQHYFFLSQGKDEIELYLKDYSQ